MGLRENLQRRGALSRGSGIVTGDYFQFAGGLNLTDPPLIVAPGQVLGCKNYDPSTGINGGYDRMLGYERFDGGFSPTDTPFTAIAFSGATQSLGAEGDTLTMFTGLVATAVGTIAYVSYTDDPTNSEGWVVLYDVTGTFDDSGQLWVQGDIGSDPATADIDSVEEQNAAPTTELLAEFESARSEWLRSLIGKVGGAACTGPVRGVHIYNAKVYAFRDSADESEGTMWEATSSGWTQVDLGWKLPFTVGTEEIVEGQTIEGATSLVTAVAKRVVLVDGTWGTDAQGYICGTGAVPAFTPAEILEVGGNPVATAGTVAGQTLEPGGHYRFRNWNFGGALDQFRMYGVTGGIDYGFEYDGDVFVQIETGMEIDTPEWIGIHNNHLLFGFAGGSLQNSGYGEPLSWNPITGADERTVGDTITGIQEETDRVTIIYTRQKKFVFQGDVVENFQCREYTTDSGAIPNSVAKLGQTLLLDDIGITSLQATARFGNFQAAAISDKIQPALMKLLLHSYPVEAVVVKRKNLWRLMFNDGTMLTIGARPNGKYTGWLSQVLPDAPYCATSGEWEEGNVFSERVFYGAENGYVYEMEKGRSFDGEAIEAFLRFAYHQSRTPERFKRYRRAQVDLSVIGPTALLATVDYDFGNREGQIGEQIAFNGNGGFWDIASWSEFVWSTSAFAQVVIKIEGTGYNIGLFFYSNTAVCDPHTLNGVALQYSPRRLNRGSQET